MIFVTVGTQLPFDRLIFAVDAWSERHPEAKVFGQIAVPGPRGHWPRHFEAESFLAPERVQALYESASLIVAHAGMGSIINALMLPRPIVVMPRRAAFGEHRTDHQVATASKFATQTGITVINDADELARRLDAHATSAAVRSSGALISPYAQPALTEAIRTFALGGVDSTR